MSVYELNQEGYPGYQQVPGWHYTFYNPVTKTYARVTPREGKFRIRFGKTVIGPFNGNTPTTCRRVEGF